MLKVISDNSINIGETCVKNTCLNLIKYENDNWRVDLYNSVDYLNSYVGMARKNFLGNEGCRQVNF